MGARKISVSLPEELVGKIAAAAQQAGLSVSAWITRSATHALRIEQGQAAVAEWEAEHGSFTTSDLTRAAAELADLDRQMLGDGDTPQRRAG
jgi:hypothetical protein